MTEVHRYFQLILIKTSLLTQNALLPDPLLVLNQILIVLAQLALTTRLRLVRQHTHIRICVSIVSLVRNLTNYLTSHLVVSQLLNRVELVP